MRSLEELMNVQDPVWPTLHEYFVTSGATIFPTSPEQGQRALWQLQMPADTLLGAIALNTGGIVADNGWFRLYGGGSDYLPSVAWVNGFSDDSPQTAPPGALHVGHDALGGRFAIDGGALGVQPGEICYFGLDTLQWERLHAGHNQFISALVQGLLGGMFENLRWPGWEAEVATLAPNQGLSIYPPLWADEGKEISESSRGIVPIEELLTITGRN